MDLKIEAQTIDRVHTLVYEGVDLKKEPIPYPSKSFWRGLKELGSELWLDTGDIEKASNLWAREFTALTTNNTLLNAEVQKGIYDNLIKRAGKVLQSLPIHERVREIAFILNARHGLALVQRFGGKVSVELHTDIAQDMEKTLFYARRFHQISPEFFIIKVPLTPAGLIATRKLRMEKIPVNFTLGFSARHNYIATTFAFPSYVNVFLGRLNSYMSDNHLGNGIHVGEKATLASQRSVKKLRLDKGVGTKQIAASMRDAGQVKDLAGVDVMTMPVKVCEDAEKGAPVNWESCIEKDYSVEFFSNVNEKDIRASTLWDVTEEEKEFAGKLVKKPPASPMEIVDMSHELGIKDLFPGLSQKDLNQIASDGKIPVHKRWEDRIKRGDLAIDTLINLAGLASFMASQKELDDRVRGLIS